MTIPRALRALSYSNVMATLAFFVAIGGTSYAAVTLTGANIKDGTVRSADIADGLYGVQSRDVKNGSLGAIDLSRAARASLKGNAGATGATGATGASGATGPASPDGPAGGSLAGNFPNPTLSANSVGASQVADDSITGSDVNESTLAKVPSAADADTLGGRNPTAFVRAEVQGLTGTALSGTPRSAAVTLTAPTNGIVILTGTCAYRAGASELYARMSLKRVIGGGSAEYYYDSHVPASKYLASSAVQSFVAIASVTATYSIEVSDIDSQTDGFCSNGKVALLFVPFKADGAAY